MTDYLGSVTVGYADGRERTAALDARSTVTVEGPRRGDRYGARAVNVVQGPQHELADVSLSGRTLTVSIVDRAPAEHQLDAKSILTVEGPSRIASGGLNFYDRVTTKISLAGAKTIGYAKAAPMVAAPLTSASLPAPSSRRAGNGGRIEAESGRLRSPQT